MNLPDQNVLLPSSRALLKGIQWFIIFTAIGVGVALWWKTPVNIRIFQDTLAWTYVIFLIPLVGVDYLLGGIRFRFFFDGKILPHISLWDCMRSNWANLFMAVVTPFNTGGGPAQLYILWRKGARISDGLLVSLINFIATLVFLLIASVTVLIILPEGIFGSQLTRCIQGSFVAVGGLSGIVLFVLLFPVAGVELIQFIFRMLPVRVLRVEGLRDRLIGALERETLRFGEKFTQIRRHRKGTLAANLFVTIALYFNKYLIGYLIARALLQNVAFTLFMGLQILNYFLSFMAPTPGASGLAELSSVWLMESVMSQDVLLLFACLWRFFTVILGAFIGAAVIFIELKKEVKRVFPIGDKDKDRTMPIDPIS